MTGTIFRNLWRAGLAVAALSFAAAAPVSAAQEAPKGSFQVAQLTFDLRGGDAQILRRLAEAGYTNVKITKSGFASVQLEGCSGGDRYAINYRRLGGRLRRGPKIGDCRDTVNARQVARQLQQDGYRNVEVAELEDDTFEVSGCKGNRAFTLAVNEFGDITNTTRAGRCGRSNGPLSVAEARRALRKEGYDRIKLDRENDRRIRFSACRNDTRFAVQVVRRNGRIRERDRLGSCRRPIDPKNLAQVVEKERGYDRIAVVDDELPTYVVEACNKTSRVRLIISRFGDIRQEKGIGDCDPPVSQEDVQAFLVEAGFNRSEVRRLRSGGYEIFTCNGLDRFNIVMTQYGDVRRRRQVGQCDPAPRLNDLVDQVGKRLNNVEVFVEGCTQRNRRFRVKYNAWGEEVSRERIGRCS